MSAGRGMPLLSGPPPQATEHENSCRKCNKEFNMLFARSRRCNHCGYSYCHSCSDYQALMPRSNNSGYDPMPVCAYCIESLNITAAGKGQLRGLSLAKLKKYANDYGIDVRSVVEKDDLIDRIIGARAPNGCLPPQRERYYRLHAIPARSAERPRGSSQQTSQRQQQQPQPRARTTSQPSFARPDLEPDATYPPPRNPPPRDSPYFNANNSGPQNNANNPPRPNTTTPRPSPHNPSPHPYPHQNTSSPHLSVPPTNPRPRSASTPRAPAGTSRATSPPPRPSLPTLDELLTMSTGEVQALPISTLKAVLFRNHVNASMVVEKSELVAKVQTLIDDERAEREAHARREEEEERELQEALEQSRMEHEEREEASRREREGQQEQQAGNQTGGASSEGTSTPSPAPAPSPSPSVGSHEEPPRGKMSTKAQHMASHLERTGLCVICQDEEANIAIVDCGHLCMCRPCSDLIMNGTRECPLCRTRIITEARLLRIFKS